MKNTCSLNHPRSETYSLEMKSRICSACIDADQTNCEQGSEIIRAYRREQDKEAELKKKLAQVILAQQEELKHPNRLKNKANQETIVEEMAKLSEKIAKIKKQANMLDMQNELLSRKLKSLGR